MIGFLGAILNPAGLAFPKSTQKIITDPKTGEKYWVEFMLVPSGSGGFKGVKRRHYVLKRYDFQEEPITGSRSPGVSIDGPTSTDLPIQGNEVTDQQSYDNAIGDAQAQDDTLNVDPDSSYSSYQFGSAGTSAAVQVFGYGVLVSVSGLGEKAERIRELRKEIGELETALNVQIESQQNSTDAIRETIADKSAKFDDVLSSIGDLPVIKAADPLAATADGQEIFATPDPFLAARLSRMARTISATSDEKIPSILRDVGYASIRQADVESAVGDAEISDSLVRIARTVADLGVGIDPVTGAVRSSYELFTGVNLITGETLTDVERGIAAVNLMMLGGFSSFQKAAVGISKVARIVGGAKGLAVIERISEIATKWPTKTIDRLLKWRSTGEAVLQDSRIGLSSSRAIVPVGAVDGWYARVMETKWADELLNGGKLSGDSVAFITERGLLEGVTSRSEVAKRLALLNSDNPALLRDLSDHVIVEFRFISNEPLGYLASPFGEVGRYGPGFLPGGYTAGGAREWLVDSEAISKGLIDQSTLKFRPLTDP